MYFDQEVIQSRTQNFLAYSGLNSGYEFGGAWELVCVIVAATRKGKVSRAQITNVKNEVVVHSCLRSKK